MIINLFKIVLKFSNKWKKCFKNMIFKIHLIRHFVETKIHLKNKIYILF